MIFAISGFFENVILERFRVIFWVQNRNPTIFALGSPTVSDLATWGTVYLTQNMILVIFDFLEKSVFKRFYSHFWGPKSKFRLYFP